MDQETAPGWKNLLLSPWPTEASTYAIYQFISLPGTLVNHVLDPAAFAGVRMWRSLSYPSMDVCLRIFSALAGVLLNTWNTVPDLLTGNGGITRTYVLDDWPSDDRRSMSESFSFSCIPHSDLPVYKKSANLRHTSTLHADETTSLTTDAARAS